LLRWIWYLAAAVVVACAALVSLGQYYFSYLDDYREPLVRMATARLPFGVEVDALHADWTGLAPTFRVRGLRLHAPEDPAITILAAGESEIRIDIIRSLFALAPRLRHIVAGDVQLGFREDAAGHWSIAGAGAPRSPANREAILDFFLAIEEITLERSRIVLQPAGGERVETQDARLSMQNYLRLRRLGVQLRDAASGAALDLLLEARGDPRKRGDFSARAYARLDQVQLSRLQPLAGARLRLPRGSLSGELWADVDAGGRWSLRGNVDSPELELPVLGSGRRLEPLRDIALALRLDYGDGSGTAWISRGSATWYGQSLELERLRLEARRGADASHGEFAAEYLDVGALAGIATASKLLDGPWGDALAELAPYGGLVNARLSLDKAPAQPLRFRLRSQFKDLSASPWRSAPGVRNAQGYVDLDARGGHVDLDSGAITLEFPRLYHQDIDFASARGRVSWSRDPGGLSVGSELLQLQDEIGSYAARFGLRLNRNPEIEDEFTLAVGMGAGDVSLRDRFVPYTVDERLRAWIDRAVLDGRVEEGAFAMRSAFGRPDGSRALSVQLALGLAEAAVDFHPDWPPVTGARGRLLVDGRVTRVQLEDGEILGSRIRDVRVNVQPGPDGRRVMVDGRVDSDLGAVLRFVNGSPLARITRGAVGEWRGSGPVALDLELDLPLTKAPVPDNARIDVKAELGGNRLSLGGLGITVDGLRGALGYGLAEGLSSERLEASLWGRPTTARISPAPGRPGAIRIEAEGAAGVPDVERWLGVAVGGAVSGETAFRLLAEQREHGFETRVESDLRGIVSDLPAPLAKDPAEPRALRVDWSARGEGAARISAALTGVGSLEADRDSDGRVAGEILLGEGKPPAAGGEGLRLRGRLGEADAGEWIVATSRLLAQNAGRGIGDGGFRVDGFELQSARLLGAELPGLRLDSRRLDGDFLLAFSAGEISGEFRAPADRGQPLGLQLTTLDLARFLPVKPDTLPEPDAGVATAPPDAAPPPPEDPWNRLAGARVPLLDVHIDALRRGEVALGEWRFQLGSEGEVLAIREAVATLPGARLAGVAGKGGASLQLSWVDGAARTALAAGLVLTDAEAFFRNAGYDPPVDSRKGSLDLSLAWPGNPLALKMADARGLLDLAFEDGRLLRGGGNNPLMRTFGLLRFDELFRRLRLDFKDFYESGLAFDRFEAGIDVGGGFAKTREPVALRGPTARLRLSGQTDLRQDLIEADLIVTLPIGSNLPWLAALAGGLPAAAGAYVASRLFEDQLGRFSSAVYKVTGSLEEPQLDFVKVFDQPEPPR
jgi:uncharacterized protein (TIGR02099 family)